MQKVGLGSAAVGVITFAIVLIACAPRSGGPAEGAEGTASDANQPRRETTQPLAPVSVDIAFTGIDGAECTYEMKVDGVASDQVTLHKNPDNGANRATWKFSGVDFELAWAILLDNGLDRCLQPLVNFPKGPQGFEIRMPGGTTETTVNEDSCAAGTYPYALRAKKGAAYCGADPKVKIED